jgi:hypothetical protein
MPRLRRGPNGPKKRLAGKKGTNRKTSKGGGGTSGMSHEKYMAPKSTRGNY